MLVKGLLDIMCCNGERFDSWLHTSVAVAAKTAAEGGDQTRPGTWLGLDALLAESGSGFTALGPSIAVKKLGTPGTLGTPVFGAWGGGVQPQRLFLLTGDVGTA